MDGSSSTFIPWTSIGKHLKRDRLACIDKYRQIHNQSGEREKADTSSVAAILISLSGKQTLPLAGGGPETTQGGSDSFSKTKKRKRQERRPVSDENGAIISWTAALVLRVTLFALSYYSTRTG